MLGYPVRDLGPLAGTAGSNVTSWDGKDERGAAVESGVYWLVLRVEGERTRKLRIAVRR